jgi:hypothetical protein
MKTQIPSSNSAKWAGVEIDETTFNPVCGSQRCVPPVNYNKRCIGNKLTDYSVPYFGYYFMGQGNFDPFTNRDRLMYFLNSQVRNPVIIITCGLHYSFDDTDKIIQNLYKIRPDIGLILAPYISQGHYLRDQFMKDLFIIKKLYEKYKEKVVCVQTMDEPRNNMAGNDLPFKNFDHMKEIYPTDLLKLKNKQKYIDRYFELAPTATKTNNRQTKADIYALYRTDIEVYKDVLGPCVPLWANLSFVIKREPAKTILPTKENAKQGWTPRNLKLIDFLRDNVSITWIGSDNYYNTKYNINNNSYLPENVNEINQLIEITNQIQPDTYQFVPVLQSNNYLFPYMRAQDTCNLDVEKKIKEWNSLLIDIYLNKFTLNPHFPRFPMVLTFALNSPEKGHGYKAADCFKASPNINYLQNIFSNT